MNGSQDYLDYCCLRDLMLPNITAGEHKKKYFFPMDSFDMSHLVPLTGAGDHYSALHTAALKIVEILGVCSCKH